LGLEGDYGIDPSQLAKNGFAVSYDAASNRYIIDVPSKPAGGFYEYTGNSPNSEFWGGALEDPSAPGTFQVGDFSVYKPSPANSEIQLSYTSFVWYHNGCPMGCTFGVMAFGSATPASAIPVSGSASYQARIAGNTLDSTYYIKGTSTLNFNFAAGTLGGHFDPLIYDMGGGALPLGRYDFANTVFGVGSTNFSGNLTHSGTSELGAFEGLFTGPNAQELMARWTAPYLNPATKQWSDMFGVWVGKKD